MEKEVDQGRSGEWLLATWAVLGAIAASSCCVLPLLFVSVGISGAWIGTLTKLAPYQPIFLAVAAGCIAAGFWSIYGRKQVVCEGPECGTATSRRMTKLALWTGVVILIAAGSAEWWATLLS
jgi:mercuric ion transport protein